MMAWLNVSLFTFTRCVFTLSLTYRMKLLGTERNSNGSTPLSMCSIVYSVSPFAITTPLMTCRLHDVTNTMADRAINNVILLMLSSFLLNLIPLQTHVILSFHNRLYQRVHDLFL